MKNKILFILTFLIGSIVYSQDEISKIVAPDDLKVGKEITVKVTYTASENRDVTIAVQLSKDPWTGVAWAKKTVTAGSGTIDIKVKISESAAPGSDYKIAAVIKPVGKAWKDRLDQKTKSVIISE